MSKAERCSYDYVEQTCPKVDVLERNCLGIINQDLINSVEKSIGCLKDDTNFAIYSDIMNMVEKRISTLIGKVKEVASEPLRSALIDVVEENMRLDKELDYSQREVDDLRYEVEYWKNYSEEGKHV